MIYPVRECDDGHDLNMVFSSTQNTFHILCCNDSKRKLVLKKVIDFMFPVLVTSMFACYFKLCAVACSFQKQFFQFSKTGTTELGIFFFFPQQSLGNEASNANGISSLFLPLIIIVINEFLILFKAFQIKLCRYDDMLCQLF